MEAVKKMNSEQENCQNYKVISSFCKPENCQYEKKSREGLWTPKTTSLQLFYEI